MESIGINNQIKNKQQLEVFYFLQLVNKYDLELELFKKYLLVLYLTKTKNINSHFTEVKRKPKLDTQIELFIKELSRYNNLERFQNFILMNNFNYRLEIIPYTENEIKFIENDLWFEIKKMRSLELGELLYERI